MYNTTAGPWQPRGAVAEPGAARDSDRDGRGRARSIRRPADHRLRTAGLLCTATEGVHGRLGSPVHERLPTGKVLPCHAAETLPGLDFPTVRSSGLTDIWDHRRPLAVPRHRSGC